MSLCLYSLTAVSRIVNTIKELQAFLNKFSIDVFASELTYCKSISELISSQCSWVLAIFRVAIVATVAGSVYFTTIFYFKVCLSAISVATCWILVISSKSLFSATKILRPWYNDLIKVLWTDILNHVMLYL